MNDVASGGALVCGFSDVAAGVGGLAWRLGEEGGLVMIGDDVHDAEVQLADGGETIELRLSSPEGETQAKLAPRTGRLMPEAAGGAPPGGALEAAACTAEVKPAGQRRTLQCFGHLSSWAEDPSEGAGAFRHLAIERSDGALLLVVTRGEGSDHGTEQTAAWLLDGEGGIMTFGEALLSTQYDKDGRHVRAGIELWPGGDEAPPMRAAGTRLGGTEGGGSLSAALLRCSSEGSEGLGSYVVKRS